MLHDRNLRGAMQTDMMTKREAAGQTDAECMRDLNRRGASESGQPGQTRHKLRMVGLLRSDRHCRASLAN